MSIAYTKYLTEQELNTRVSVLDIVPGTIVDGVGLRTSIYFAGCAHHCEGCHNQQSWDINNGKMMTIREILSTIEENGFNVTLSGGDPLYQIDEMLILTKGIKQALGKNIWCYTGYSIEEIKANDKLKKILSQIDVIVEGRFILAERDTTLRFRGSHNQRILNARDLTPWQD